jgi:hypothetical protein
MSLHGCVSIAGRGSSSYCIIFTFDQLKPLLIAGNSSQVETPSKLTITCAGRAYQTGNSKFRPRKTCFACITILLLQAAPEHFTLRTSQIVRQSLQHVVSPFLHTLASAYAIAKFSYQVSYSFCCDGSFSAPTSGSRTLQSIFSSQRLNSRSIGRQ